jgi:hypothetical protein
MLSCYWVWYEEQDRISFLQKAMEPCAREHWSAFLDHALDRTDPTIVWPPRCPVCDGELEQNRVPLYATLYRGKLRRDLVVPFCGDCFSTAYPEITQNATRLTDRRVGARAGGAPFPSPTVDEAPVAELPW